MACVGTGHLAEAHLRPSIWPSRRRTSETSSGPMQYRLQNFPPPPSRGLEAAVADAIAEQPQHSQRGVAAQTSSKGLPQATESIGLFVFWKHAETPWDARQGKALLASIFRSRFSDGRVLSLCFRLETV